jgi:uncharacterized UPF0160 family protein
MKPIPDLAVTHGGVFHADDVFAFSFLKLINPHLKLMRVNKVTPFFLDQMTDKYGERFIVFDIGGGEFDHHTPETVENRTREHCKAPYASFGKVVREYWPGLLDSEKQYLLFDTMLCVPIDTQDCMGKLFHGDDNKLSAAIGAFNPTFLEDQNDTALEHSFLWASAIAQPIIKRYIAKAKSVGEGEVMVKKAINSAKKRGERYAVMMNYAPYQRLMKDEPIDWVIYPSLRGGWQLYAVKGINGVDKAIIPPDMMEKMKKDPCCTFVHVGGFTATFEALIDAQAYAEKLTKKEVET